MDWKSFQRLKVKDAPAWAMDLFFIPAAILLIEWLWFVNNRPVFAFAAGVLVLGARQLTRHLFARRRRGAGD
jgi:hypothetical protein